MKLHEIFLSMRDCDGAIYKFDFIKDIDSVDDPMHCSISQLKNVIYFEYEDESLRDIDGNKYIFTYDDVTHVNWQFITDYHFEIRDKNRNKKNHNIVAQDHLEVDDE